MDTTYRDSEGAVTIRHHPQMLACDATGRATVAMVHWYIREFHAFADAATKRMDVFHDWTKVTGFSAEARSIFLAWGRERNAYNRRVCRGVHVLVESTVVFLALEAASTFTRGYMIPYRKRRTFILEREAHLRNPSSEPVAR